jgi:gas vesicle protein
MGSKTLAGFGIGLIAGAVIGGVMALLYAPKSGKETRKVIKDKTIEVADVVKEETGAVIDAVKDKTSEVVEMVKEEASEVNRKGHVVAHAIKN